MLFRPTAGWFPINTVAGFFIAAVAGGIGSFLRPNILTVVPFFVTAQP
jgi:hypothetical protein